MNKATLRAVGYRRVSMREQVDGFSLDAQDNNIRQYVELQGWEFVDLYTDAGISAKKDSHRPSLERLMKDAELHRFDVIVVDKVDRFIATSAACSVLWINSITGTLPLSPCRSGSTSPRYGVN